MNAGAYFCGGVAGQKRTCVVTVHAQCFAKGRRQEFSHGANGSCEIT